MIRNFFETLLEFPLNLPIRHRRYDLIRWRILHLMGVKTGHNEFRRNISINRYGKDKNIIIGKNNFFNEGIRFSSGENSKIVIGDNCLFGPNVSLETIYHNTHYSEDYGWGLHEGDIIIEDKVWIGAGAIILANVKVGTNSVIAAGALVNKDVPPNSIYGGVPARLIRKNDHDAIKNNQTDESIL